MALKLRFLSLFLLFNIAISGISLYAQTYTVDNVPNVQLRNKRAFVSNPDGIITQSAVATMDSMLYHLRQTNDVEFAVVLLNSIGDNDPRMFANELFQKWGIGRGENNNGLLLLFVKDQRQALTEVGYGLEGILPDAINKRLLSAYMLPFFREGDYSRGMVAGVAAFVKYLTSDEANKELMLLPKQRNAVIKSSGSIYSYIIIYLIVSIIVLAFFWGGARIALQGTGNKSVYQKYKALHGYSNFIALTCILFPATMIPFYIWLRNKLNSLRNTPQICDTCQTKMHKLSEQEEDEYLSQQQQTEERINSIDYDVWLCDTCHKTKILPYESAYTNYKSCPVCHAKAYGLKSDRVLVHPTQFSKGTGEKTYVCENCKHIDRIKYLIPMIVIVSSGRRGGGGFGGGGGSRGGGFGGGRSGGGGGSIGW